MVATKGFGMGIDKPNIRLVIHRTLTGNLEAYAQEAGRAGRDGELATTILYYSPDRPQDDDSQGKRSDHEIQSFFISDKYIRPKDVQVMRAFLKQVRRKVGDNLYFTNDEAIGFFNRASVGNTPYTWPGFPPRQPSGKEFDEHKAVLDRGHEYQEQTKYLDRILQVLYRIRPDGSAGGSRAAFLEHVQETKAELRRVWVKNAVAILDSNFYFGQLLREARLDEWELTDLLTGGDLFALARRLTLSLREAVAVVSDIKFAEGSRDARGHWQPALLEFKAHAPRFGPAAGKDTLAAWRDYAGARSRAGDARNRAKARGRPKPCLDDWFGWRELNRSRGWEVQPGPAFYDDDEFDTFLDAFMALHERRKANDWESYNRLLTDYIGVSEDGTASGWKRPKQCLRAVMLGYLKTYEVVKEGNCRSCNYCVPDERFERYSLAERREAIDRIEHRVEAFIERAEAFGEARPPQALIAELFASMREQPDKGLVQYIQGWTARLLQDSPDHRAAAWIRLKAMAEGDFELQPREFTELARRLDNLATEADVPHLWALLRNAHEILPGEPQIHGLQANICHRANLNEEELAACRRLVALHEHGQLTNRIQMIRSVFERLRFFYQEGGPFADPPRHQECLLSLARLSTEAEDAARFYFAVTQEWAWEQVLAELERCRAAEAMDSATIGLLCAWLQANKSKVERHEAIMSYLESEGWASIAKANMADVRLLVDVIGAARLRRHPLAAARFADVLLDHENREDWQEEIGVSLCLSALSNGQRVAAPALEAVVRKVGKGGRHVATINRLLEEYWPHRRKVGSILTALAEVLPPLSARDLEQWFAIFPAETSHATPEIALRVLRSAPASGLAGPTLQALHAMTAPFLTDRRSGRQIHEAWMPILRHHPAHLATYIRTCLRQQPPSSDRAESGLDLLLTTTTDRDIKAFLTYAQGWPERVHSLRIVHAVDFFLACSTVEKQLGGLPHMSNRGYLLALRRAMTPLLDVHRADMLVALIETMRERANPNWLTPVEFQAEALCDARRLDEAAVLQQQYPEMRIGPNRELLGERVARLRQQGPARHCPPGHADYIRIARACFMRTAR